MDIGGFKINPMIYNMFGGKAKKKKAKQKKRKKSKRHMDYSKIKLNKLDTDSKNPMESQDNESAIYDMKKSSNSNIDISSVLSIDDSINTKDNKSRESECDSEDENELIINSDHIDNEPIDTNDPPTLHMNYSSSPAVSSEIFDIEYECEDRNDLCIDMNNITAINARESEIESPSQSNQTDSPSYKYEYNFSDITTFGAIKTPKIETPIVEPNEPNNSYDLFECLYNETFELSYSDIELSDTNIENNFKNSRRKSIESDLLDLMISDSETIGNDETDNDNEIDNGMTIIELLHIFKIDSLMCYFDEILSIEYVNEIINYEPNIIKRGLMCNNIPTMICVYKMFKYLCNEVINGNLNGKKCKQWIELVNNTIYNTFVYKSEYLINYKQINNYNTNKNNLKYKHWDFICLNGFDKKYVQNIRIHKCMRQELELKILINKLPNKYRFEPGLFKIGIENKHNDRISNIYIDDRLVIKRNDLYKNIMYSGNDFVENGSAICMKIKTVKFAKKKYLAINICHETRDNKLYSKNYKLKLHKHKNTAKVFIEQFNGFGEYAVLY